MNEEYQRWKWRVRLDKGGNVCTYEDLFPYAPTEEKAIAACLVNNTGEVVSVTKIWKIEDTVCLEYYTHIGAGKADLYYSQKDNLKEIVIDFYKDYPYGIIVKIIILNDIENTVFFAQENMINLQRISDKIHVTYWRIRWWIAGKLHPIDFKKEAEESMELFYKTLADLDKAEGLPVKNYRKE